MPNIAGLAASPPASPGLSGFSPPCFLSLNSASSWVGKALSVCASSGLENCKAASSCVFPRPSQGSTRGRLCRAPQKGPPEGSLMQALRWSFPPRRGAPAPLSGPTPPVRRQTGLIHCKPFPALRSPHFGLGERQLSPWGGLWLLAAPGGVCGLAPLWSFRMCSVTCVSLHRCHTLLFSFPNRVLGAV